MLFGFRAYAPFILIFPTILFLVCLLFVLLCLHVNEINLIITGGAVLGGLLLTMETRVQSQGRP
jgi:hypothetical protein